MWSKSKVIRSAQYLINSLPFHFTSIRPTIPEIELHVFQNLTLKNPRSNSSVRSKATYYTQYIQTMHFLFCLRHMWDICWLMVVLNKWYGSMKKKQITGGPNELKIGVNRPSVFLPIAPQSFVWTNEWTDKWTKEQRDGDKFIVPLFSFGKGWGQKHQLVFATDVPPVMIHH